MGQKRDEDWSASMGRRIAAAIRERRGRMSTETLAKRCGDLGWPVSRSKIANLENVSRTNETLEELLVIAAALGVPPLLLLFPQLAEPVEVLPGRTVGAVAALDWASGSGLPEALAADETSRRTYDDATHALTARITHHELATDLFLADHDRDSPQGQARYRRAVLALANHENVMAANGWPIVPLQDGFPADLAAAVALVRQRYPGRRFEGSYGEIDRAAAEVFTDDEPPTSKETT